MKVTEALSLLLWGPQEMAQPVAEVRAQARACCRLSHDTHLELGVDVVQPHVKAGPRMTPGAKVGHSLAQPSRPQGAPSTCSCLSSLVLGKRQELLLL